jgi:aspartyl-tRNA(Asn)/glutamyl-tRNA(Gln) amidotransferase subunit A
VFGRSVADAELVLEAISGFDPRDATSANRAPLRSVEPPRSLAGVTIGVPKEYFPADLHDGVRAGCLSAIARMKSLGATMVEVSLPHSKYAVPAYYIIAPAEAAANLARYDGARFGKRGANGGDLHAVYRATRGHGFGAEVRRRILVGTYVLSAGYAEAYYRRAQAARSRIAEDFTTVFASGVDLLFTPTTPTPAFKAGEKTADPVAMYLADVFVCPASLAGLPAMSLPIGRCDGLPLGGQLMAPPFEESRMLAIARTLEQHLDPLAEVSR